MFILDTMNKQDALFKNGLFINGLSFKSRLIHLRRSTLYSKKA